MASGFFDLAGLTALVTGGGRGIGAAIARRLHAAGAGVAVLDLDRAAADPVARAIGGVAIEGDVTREDDVARAIERVAAELGPVDILVNNAGIAGTNDLTWNLSRDQFEMVLRVNLVGPFLLCKAVVPGMLARRFGRIVNVASIAGKEGNPRLGAYSASKAGLIALTKSLAKEVAGQGDVTVNSISPAVVETDLLKTVSDQTRAYMISKIPLGRTGTVEEIAALVHYLVSRDAGFTTGQCYDISGGRATY